MKNEIKNAKTIKAMRSRRKAISLSSESLVEITQNQPNILLPLLVRATVDGLDLKTWILQNKNYVSEKLLKHGGILFRNFDHASTAQLEETIQATSGDLLEYTYRSTPRTQVSSNIYTSTEYPADQSIPLHNEMSYSRNWPMKIWFMCVKPAEQGGETPIADSRRVFERIPAAIRKKFSAKQIMYVRSYGDGLDLSWQDVFQTTDRSQVEHYCKQVGIDFEWKGSNNLITKQVCQAEAKHPVSHESVWFNQAHLFHVSGLPESIYNFLVSEFKERNREFPRNSYYGDGSEIEPDVLNIIRQAYQDETVLFTWQTNDILMLDNMLAAHGRRPFSGSRQVVVGMSN